MNFPEWMKTQYQYDEQFDLEIQYSQEDMRAAYEAGSAEISRLQAENERLKEENAYVNDMLENAHNRAIKAEQRVAREWIR